jgi:hypothetical protein
MMIFVIFILDVSDIGTAAELTASVCHSLWQEALEDFLFQKHLTHDTLDALSLTVLLLTLSFFELLPRRELERVRPRR